MKKIQYTKKKLYIANEVRNMGLSVFNPKGCRCCTDARTSNESSQKEPKPTTYNIHRVQCKKTEKKKQKKYFKRIKRKSNMKVIEQTQGKIWHKVDDRDVDFQI